MRTKNLGLQAFSNSRFQGNCKSIVKKQAHSQLKNGAGHLILLTLKVQIVSSSIASLSTQSQTERESKASEVRPAGSNFFFYVHFLFKDGLSLRQIIV